MNVFFKSLSLFIFLSFFLSSSSFAQKYFLGAKIGINRANFIQNGDYLVAIPNANLGVSFSYRLKNWLHLNTEVDYSGQGAKTHKSDFFLFSIFDTSIKPTKVFYNTENIRSSFFLNFSNLKNNRFSPNIVVGIYNSFLNHSSTEIKEGDHFAIGDVVSTIDEKGYTLLDVGGLLGIGLKYKTEGQKQVLFDYRHYFGMVDISKSPNHTVKNSVGSFNFSLLIPLKRILNY